MKTLLRPEPVTKFSWLGKKNNIAISDYAIIALLVDCALEQMPKLNKEQVEAIIRKWFFRTKDTLRKLLRKEGRLDSWDTIAEQYCDVKYAYGFCTMYMNEEPPLSS
jgi:hypothetical protein